MTVIDMRNFFHDCDVELIEINDEVIYYAEEKVEAVSYTHLDVYKRQPTGCGRITESG